MENEIEQHKQYSMFIGRWQPWHPGHQWLVDQRLRLGKNVLICIRDVPKDEKNPFSPEEVFNNLIKIFEKEIAAGTVEVMVFPDIESVNYGRGVGYEVIEHVPPADIHNISATKIREQLREEGKIT